MDNLLTFNIVAISLMITSLVSVLFAYLTKNRKLPLIIFAIGIVIFAFYIAVLWISLDRAPLRTLGETRLWYAFFVAVIGWMLYYRWNFKWVLLFSAFMTDLFLLINLASPENFDKTLMPALQSYWFVPHVIVYIFAYSILGISTLFALKGLYQMYKNKFDEENLIKADNLVYIGFAFLTFGLIFGALWAKEAWGHYWTWDPKETWAFITWLLYLLFIHYRKHRSQNIRTAMVILSVAFLILLICWFGVNYMPSAQNSVHVYSR